MFNETPAQKINRLFCGVRQIVNKKQIWIYQKIQIKIECEELYNNITVIMI